MYANVWIDGSPKRQKDRVDTHQPLHLFGLGSSN